MTNQINNQSITPSTDVIQLNLTLKMTTAQVTVETSVTLSTTTVLFRTTFTRKIKLNLLLMIYIRTKNIRDGSGVGFKVFDKRIWEILVILGHCNHPDTNA